MVSCPITCVACHIEELTSAFMYMRISSGSSLFPSFPKAYKCVYQQ